MKMPFFHSQQSCDIENVFHNHKQPLHITELQHNIYRLQMPRNWESHA